MDNKAMDNRSMPDRQALEEELRRTLETLKTSSPRFAFDRDGRPAAIGAVRAALPTLERELLDAVLEDCDCELAATREALFRMLERLRK